MLEIEIWDTESRDNYSKIKGHRIFILRQNLLRSVLVLLTALGYFLHKMSSSRVHTFYLVRHGETAGNLARILLPPEEDVLSPGGILEAGLLGEAFKDVKFTKVYCSSYPRAVTTTEIILNKNNLSEKIFEKDFRLREICCGIYDGGPYAPIFKTVLEFLHQGLDKMDWRIDGAETFNDMLVRGKSFMEDCFKQLDSSEKDETVLLVCHGFFNTGLLESLYRSPDINVTNWDDSCSKVMRNATYTKFTLSSKSTDTKRTMTILKLHEKSHLNEMTEEDSLTKASKTPEGKPLSGCFQV